MLVGCSEAASSDAPSALGGSGPNPSSAPPVMDGQESGANGERPPAPALVPAATAQPDATAAPRDDSRADAAPPAPEAGAGDDMVANEPGVFATDRDAFGLGGPSRCAAGAVDVCESFEQATPGAGAPPGWNTDGYGTRTLAVVEDDSARGARSFRIDVAGAQGAVVGMLVRQGLGGLGERHFGRVFMKIGSPAPASFVHWDVFEGRGSFGGGTNMVRWSSTGTGVGTERGNWSWIYNVQTSDRGEFGTEGSRSAHPVIDEWMCLEWFFDQPAAEARFFHDGVEIEDLHIDTERSEIPVFDSLRVGFQKFQQTDAFRVWVDEIAFDDQRIGCQG